MSMLSPADYRKGYDLGYQRGKEHGMQQERALWELAASSQEIERLDSRSSVDRRVINDRRQQEFLTEVDRRRDEFRYGRRGTDMAPDPFSSDQSASRGAMQRPVGIQGE